MATQIPKNKHYIPPFLIKPWERDQRKLKLYDFEKSAFETASSKTVFPGEGYPQEIEKFLEDSVEKPINDLRPLLEKGEDVLAQGRYRRAATLLVALQRAWDRSATNAAFLRVLIELSQQPKAQLDALGTEPGQGISIVRVPRGARALFFPSTGLFPLLSDELQWNGWPIPAWGMSVAPEHAIVTHHLVRKSEPSARADIQRVVDQAAPALIEQASAGTDSAQKVVLPPDLKESDAAITAILIESRRANVQSIIEHNKRVAASLKSSSEE